MSKYELTTSIFLVPVPVLLNMLYPPRRYAEFGPMFNVLPETASIPTASLKLLVMIVFS